LIILIFLATRCVVFAFLFVFFVRFPGGVQSTTIQKRATCWTINNNKSY